MMVVWRKIRPNTYKARYGDQVVTVRKQLSIRLRVRHKGSRVKAHERKGKRVEGHYRKGRTTVRLTPRYYCYVGKRLVGIRSMLRDSKALLEGELLNGSASSTKVNATAPAQARTPQSGVYVGTG